MHKGFYYKLAFTNLGKNRKFYLPYMLSCILMVMLHFILCSLSYTDTWQTIPESAIVYTILNLGCYVVEIFALILLFYTNGFLMKRRKREFGLYNVLGMEKRHIGRVLFWETFFAFSASILVGLGLGILLSKLAELLLCNMLQFEIRYAWEFIPRAFLRTGSIFLLYAALMLLHSLWQLRKAKPVELLHSVSAGEREPRANWLLALVGLVLLGAGYWLAITIQNPVDALVWFFVAVILVSLGTYACFIAGSVVVLKLLRRMKGYYYKTNHFISVGGMLHRMKQNGAGLATICILSTMVLVMVSGTASLYVGYSDILHNRYPREFNFTCRGDVEASMAAAEQVRAIVDSVQRADPATKVVVMGDLNDDATDDSIVEGLNAKGKIKEVGKGDMFNPFIGLLKAGYGTLAYRDEWNLFDNIIVSENLATGSTGSLKIQPAGNSKFYGGIFRRPYMIQKEGQYKGYPLRTFVGNDFQGGFSDHFPVYIYIAK